MTDGWLILAARDEDPTMKIVIGVAIAAIWIISQIVGALTKKPDQTLPPSRPPNEVPPPPRRQPPGMPTPADSRRTIKRTKPPAMRGKPQRPVPAVLPPAAAAATRYPVESPPAPRPGTALPRRDVVNALLQPRNLKKAFVLTELLRPPVALRPQTERQFEA